MARCGPWTGGPPRSAPAGPSLSASPCRRRRRGRCSCAAGWAAAGHRGSSCRSPAVRVPTPMTGRGGGRERTANRCGSATPTRTSSTRRTTSPSSTSTGSATGRRTGSSWSPSRARRPPRRRASSPAPRGEPVRRTRPPETTADLKLAIVHHTVSGNTYSPAQVPHDPPLGAGVPPGRPGVHRHRVQRRRRPVRAQPGRAALVALTNVVRRRPQPGVQHRQPSASSCWATSPDGHADGATVETVAHVIAWKLALHRVDPASTVRFTSAGSAKYERGTDGHAPPDRGPPRRPGDGLPGRATSTPGSAPIRARVAQLVPAYQAGLAPTIAGPRRHRGRAHRSHPVPARSHAPTSQWASSAGAAHPAARLDQRRLPARGRATSTATGETTSSGTAAGRRPTTIWWSGPSGTTSQALATVNGSYVPIAGDFDGNGVDDILWYATGPRARTRCGTSGPTAPHDRAP